MQVIVSCPPPVPKRRQGTVAGGSGRGRGGGGGGDSGAGAGGKVHTIKLAVGELDLGAGQAGAAAGVGRDGRGMGGSSARVVSDPWAWQPGQPGRCGVWVCVGLCGLRVRVCVVPGGACGSSRIAHAFLYINSSQGHVARLCMAAMLPRQHVL